MDQLIFPTIGYPVSITLDRDPLFTSYVFTDWARQKGTRLDISTTYHQQTDGQTEIVNKEFRQVLKVIKEEGKNWLVAIPEIQFKLNSNYDASRKTSPFQVVYGFNPRLRLPILPYSQLIFTNTEQRYSTTSTNLTEAKINQTI